MNDLIKKLEAAPQKVTGGMPKAIEIVKAHTCLWTPKKNQHPWVFDRQCTEGVGIPLGNDKNCGSCKGRIVIAGEKSAGPPIQIKRLYQFTDDAGVVLIGVRAVDHGHAVDAARELGFDVDGLGYDIKEEGG